MKPRSAPWRTVGSIPISVAIPQIMKEIKPQSRSQRCTFESRHRDLVENGLVRSDPELGRKLKTGAAAEKPGFDGLGTVDALPCHRLTQLKQAREPRWQRHMAQENDAEVVASCKLQDFQDLAENLGAMWQLGKNARLHVVNHKRALFRCGYFLERLWNLKTCRTHRLISPGQKSRP
jgi:hypothetical protein